MGDLFLTYCHDYIDKLTGDGSPVILMYAPRTYILMPEIRRLSNGYLPMVNCISVA
jgi:hypothetical protein